MEDGIKTLLWMSLVRDIDSANYVKFHGKVVDCKAPSSWIGTFGYRGGILHGNGVPCTSQYYCDGTVDKGSFGASNYCAPDAMCSNINPEAWLQGWGLTPVLSEALWKMQGPAYDYTKIFKAETHKFD